MERAVVFAGFGGQGVLFAARILAQAAMREGREVLWTPTYGPEMRGGTAACTVIVGDEPIGSPAVDRYDAAVVLNPPSLEKYGPRVAPGGILVVNETLVGTRSGRSDITEVRVACTPFAREAGDDALVSVVALGTLVSQLPLAPPDAVRDALREIVGQKRPAILEADMTAFDLGLHSAGASGSSHLNGRLSPTQLQSRTRPASHRDSLTSTSGSATLTSGPLAAGCAHPACNVNGRGSNKCPAGGPCRPGCTCHVASAACVTHKPGPHTSFSVASARVAHRTCIALLRHGNGRSRSSFMCHGPPRRPQPSFVARCGTSHAGGGDGPVAAGDGRSRRPVVLHPEPLHDRDGRTH